MELTISEKYTVANQCKNCKYWTDAGCNWQQPEGHIYSHPVSDCGEFEAK